MVTLTNENSLESFDSRNNFGNVESLGRRSSKLLIDSGSFCEESSTGFLFELKGSEPSSMFCVENFETDTDNTHLSVNSWFCLLVDIRLGAFICKALMDTVENLADFAFELCSTRNPSVLI